MTSLYFISPFRSDRPTVGTGQPTQHFKSKPLILTPNTKLPTQVYFEGKQNV